MKEKENFALILPAAGRGRRLGADTAKVFVDLGGIPMLCRTMERFDGIELITQRIVAVRSCDVESARIHLAKWDVTVVEGGKTRQDSVAAALSAVRCTHVAIHDGARPFVSRELIQRVLEAALGTDAAIAALPLTDTVKRTGTCTGSRNIIIETIPRDHLWAAQTPQAFRTDLLRKAFEKYRGHKQIGDMYRKSRGEAEGSGTCPRKLGSPEVTDDARLVEMAGYSVHIVEGERKNIKITTPSDLEEARHIFPLL